MNRFTFKIILLVMMTTALTFGFLHHLVPPEQINFERLHIFLFNLCSGGTLLIFFTEDKPRLSRKGTFFLILALGFALCAFLQIYIMAAILSLILAVIVEQVRIHHFGSLIPKSLFTREERVPRKFHQASLLCLSLGLIIAAPVILNEVYFHWFTIEKLKLDTFFLGFSFPVSLISMSAIFTLMKREKVKITAFFKETTFWVINLGVIIFFLFILAELFYLQVIISFILFAAVSFTLYLYYKHGIRLQQKAFLTSGIIFLMITSISGIAYILLSLSSYYLPNYSQPLLRLHSFTALYGWNLSGLVVISRHADFPIQLHSKQLILFHWLTVLVLCPLGYFYPIFALFAVSCYFFLLLMLLFKHGSVDEQLVAGEEEVLTVVDLSPSKYKNSSHEPIES